MGFEVGIRGKVVGARWTDTRPEAANNLRLAFGITLPARSNLFGSQNICNSTISRGCDEQVQEWAVFLPKFHPEFITALSLILIITR